MELSEYKNIYKNEGRHFFYRANHDLFIELVKKYTPSSKLRILDAGCGTGMLGKKLKRFGNVIGIDMHAEAVSLSKKRGLSARVGSVEDILFKSGSFDLIVSMDVLYHKAVRSDLKALKEFNRVLKPGGVLIIRLPANKWLNLKHDTHVHTRRRYDKEELKVKLRKAGFAVDRITYVNTFLLPIAAIKQILERSFSKSNASEIRSVNTHLNAFLFALLSLENWALRFANLPFGLGVLAVAKKPTS